MTHALDVGYAVGTGGIDELSFACFLTRIKSRNNRHCAVQTAAAHITDGNGFGGGDMDAVGAVTNLPLNST